MVLSLGTTQHCHNISVLGFQITGKYTRCLTIYNKVSIKAPLYCPLGQGNPLVTGGFPSQRVSNAKSIFMLWLHHVQIILTLISYVKGQRIICITLQWYKQTIVSHRTGDRESGHFFVYIYLHLNTSILTYRGRNMICTSLQSTFLHEEVFTFGIKIHW